MRASSRRQHRAARLVAGGVVALLVGAPFTARAAAGPVTAGFGEVAALAAAAVSGAPVEVVGRRGESSTVFANPDGTLQMDVSNVPVRVRRETAWVPIDTTLERRADGTVAPRATTVSMVLSGGGAAPLVTLQRGNGSLSLTAPFALPAPTLAGDIATYAEVLPGVDLVVRAGADTFSERFVVKSAAAAANPDLSSLRFGTRTSGLVVRTRADGGVEAVDGRGTVVLTGPAPIMWDSAGASGANPALSAEAPGAAGAGADAAAAAVSAAAAAGSAAAENDNQPVEGDKVAPVGVVADAQGLTLKPDLALLRGVGTRYPVYLDPTLGATRNAWAMVNKTYPTTEYWKWAGDSSDSEGMGHIDDPAAGVHTKRLFYQFTTSSLNGKTIYSATFRAFETHAYSCTASKVEAWHVGTISSTTNWDHQPANIASTSTGLQSSATVAYGRSGCTPGGAWVSFDVTPAVKYQTSHSGASTTIKLKGASETSSSSWKRFKYGATLSIVYNTPPPAPSGLTMTGPSAACATGAGRAVFPNDPPVLNAKFRDSDAGENVQGSFELFTSTGTLLKTYLAPAKAPNSVQTYDLAAAGVYPLPAGMADGIYKWRVRTKDPKVYGAYSGYCEFAIDKTAPAPPTITPSAATQAAAQPGPFPFGGTATFTVSSTDAGTKTYKWSVNSGVPTSAGIAYTTPTFSVPMNVYGPATVRVWVYDQAGNASKSAASYEVPVGGFDPTRDLRANWRMDAATGATTAPDRVGVSGTAPNGASPMTLAGGAAFADGGQQSLRWPADRALQLNSGTVTGATAATTSTTVLDLKKNATVTVWVQPSSTTGRTVAVSHDATGGANLTLEQRTMTAEREDPNTGLPVEVREPHFVATVRVGATLVIADIPTPVVAGEWYHLAAGWAPGPRELTLELADADGVAIDAVTVTATADADTSNGVMRVGGAMNAAGARDSYWPGVVDEVSVFSNLIPEEQLLQLRTTAHG